MREIAEAKRKELLKSKEDVRNALDALKLRKRSAGPRYVTAETDGPIGMLSSGLK
jgi:hypothetical protein